MIRVAERPPALLTHELVQRILARAEHAAGVDQGETRCPAIPPAAGSTSRVVPAMAVTIARRESVMRLKSVDFPTFGRPTSTTVGSWRGRFRWHVNVSLSTDLDSVSVYIYSIYKS